MLPLRLRKVSCHISVYAATCYIALVAIPPVGLFGCGKLAHVSVSVNRVCTIS